MNAAQQTGRAAEGFAAAFLESRRYQILARNQRVGRGEIDIIARRSAVLVFVEVKARRTTTCGSALDAVTPQKRRQVARLAELWLSSRPGRLRGIEEIRFDVIVVDMSGRPARLRHLPAAFDSSGW